MDFDMRMSLEETIERGLLYMEGHARRYFTDNINNWSSHPEFPELLPLVDVVTLFRDNQYDKCIDTLGDYIEARRSSPSSVFVQCAYMLLSYSYSSISEFEKSILTAQKCRGLNQELSKPVMVSTFWREGTAYIALKRYNEAMTALTAAQKLAESLDDTVCSARLNVDIANVTISTGDFARAMSLLERSLLTLQGLPQYEMDCNMARINLSGVYQRVGRNEDALEEYQLLLKNPLIQNRPETAIVIMLNSAIALKSLHRMEESLKAYREVQRLSQERGFVDMHIRALIGIAHLHEVTGNIEPCLEVAKQAVQLTLENNHDVLMGEAKAALASAERLSGDISSAIDLLTFSYRKAIKDADISLAIIYGIDLSEWLAEGDRYSEAYSIQRECAEMQREIYSNEIERTLELSDIRAKMNLERETIRHRDEGRNKILHSVVPKHIAERLMSGEVHIADRVEAATIMFADIVGFTQRAVTMEPEDLVQMLETLFSEMYVVSAEFGCEQLKTIGDSYMAICGASEYYADHTARMCRAALRIIDTPLLKTYGLELRIGIHTGPVIAGVMSGSRMSYDVWGDTVNVAARMEGHSAPNQIHVSMEVADSVASFDEFKLEKREPLNIRGKGLMTTYWLTANK
jgi:class 3 adenylate cyclase/tetratricopeptide (TPR) repeat protein